MNINTQKMWKKLKLKEKWSQSFSNQKITVSYHIIRINNINFD